MRTSSRLIPPSLCQLQDLSDICSNSNIPKNQFSYALPQDSSQSNLPYTHIHIRINGPDEVGQQLPLGYTEASYNQPSNKTPSADTITLNGASTGYNNLKDRFSQEEISEAFKAIDVNKDGVLTKEDLVVFLDYVGEQYTDEEVDEMIAMFNGEEVGGGVCFEQFKRLAAGEIIGLGNSFMMDKEGKKKEAIYNNIKSTKLQNSLIAENQKLFLDALKSETINIAKFKQQRDKPNHKVSTQNKEKKVSKQQVLVERPAYTQQQHIKRRSLFQSLVKIDIETVISNFCQGKVGSKVNLRQISKLLQISQTQATQLYPYDSQISSKVVITQSITYSPLKKAQRLQMALTHFTTKSVISMVDLVRVLRLMMPYDAKLQSKLQTLVRRRGIEGELSKEMVVEMISEYSSVFVF